MKGVRLDDNDEGFYHKFATGSVAIPWQTEVRIFCETCSLALLESKVCLIHHLGTNLKIVPDTPLLESGSRFLCMNYESDLQYFFQGS